MTPSAKTPHKKNPLMIFLIEVFTARAGFHVAQSNTHEDKKRA